MADDHIGELKKARDQLIKQRRSSISALGDGYKHGDTERQLDNLIRYQRAIEAIDRADPGRKGDQPQFGRKNTLRKPLPA